MAQHKAKIFRDDVHSQFCRVQENWTKGFDSKLYKRLQMQEVLVPICTHMMIGGIESNSGLVMQPISRTAWEWGT